MWEAAAAGCVPHVQVYLLLPYLEKDSLSPMLKAHCAVWHTVQVGFQVLFKNPRSCASDL
jgi:hypothetical protein